MTRWCPRRPATIDAVPAALIQPSQVPSSVPLLPLNGTVLFPAGVLPVALGTPYLAAAAEAALSRDGLIVVVARAAPAEPLEGELLVAANAPATAAQKQRVLEAASIPDRLAIAGELLAAVAAARPPRHRLRARMRVALRRLRWRLAVARGQVPGATIEPRSPA